MILTWQIILITITIIYLAIASYTDLKKREVPDWLNFSLIFSALGLRTIFSFEYGWGILLDGLLGSLVFFGIAYLFYYTNQWGGGDSKLLIGMGAVIGLGIDFQNFGLMNYNFNLILFFIGLFLFGAIFALIWSLILAIKKRKVFFKEFKKILLSLKKWHHLSLLTGIIFLGITFFYNYFWPLIIMPGLSFYTIIFIKAVEKTCFIKKLSASQLVEGDWLAKNIVISKKELFTKNQALEKKDVWKLRHLETEGKISHVLVKEGIPFVPSFLFSYLATTFGSKIVSLFV